MAQPGNAQREPSMEEILASIRKIIEDTEHARDARDVNAAHDAPFEEKAVARPTPQEEAVTAFRDAMRNDLPTERVVPEVMPPVRNEAPSTAARPFTLADVQKRLMESRSGKPAAQPVPAHDTDQVFIDEDVNEPEVQMETAKVAEVAPQAVSEFEPLPSVGEDEIFPAEDMAPAHAPAHPALISADALRQVAGSFEELKEAFTASRKKSFDEMAEEMMRPMLQDWLDNNLPVLVERLVREEIERIARG